VALTPDDVEEGEEADDEEALRVGERPVARPLVVVAGAT
jgi:hypothetical protein